MQASAPALSEGNGRYRTAAAARRGGVERFFEFSLLGMLASGYLAVASSGYIDWPTLLLAGAGLLLRGLLVAGVLRLRISPRVVAGAALSYPAFFALDYYILSREFLPALTHMVFFLAIIRVLTAQSARDYFFVKVLAFLELLAASLLPTSINFFVFLFLFLLCTVATFTSSEILRSSRDPKVRVRGPARTIHWRLGLLAVLSTMGILVITGGLFFVLPRTAKAALQHFSSPRFRLPGFSNEVNLGDISEVKMSSEPIMHVLFEKPPPYALKWRGATLYRFDGHKWTAPAGEQEVLRTQPTGLIHLASDEDRWREGIRISYEVKLRSLDTDTVFVAGVPELLRIGLPAVLRTETDDYHVGFPGAVLHYGVLARLNPPIELVANGRRSFPEPPGAIRPAPIPPLRPDVREQYIRTPPLDPRIPRLAEAVTRGARDDLEKALALEQHLRRHYAYTLEQPPNDVADPLANFLFHRRKGHCEYFASALAILLRTQHIPSRVITGFEGGTYNPISGWYVVRASDAHSWVEAWITGLGWTTFDPTPPDTSAKSSVWSRVGLYLDAAETFWQEWVVNYDLDHQLVFAARIGEGSRNLNWMWWEDSKQLLTVTTANVKRAARTYGKAAAAVLVLSMLVWVAVPVVWNRWRQREQTARLARGQGSPGDATMLYLRLLRILKHRGFEKPAWMTPAEFARCIEPEDASRLVCEFTHAYNEFRFGGKRDAAPGMLVLIEEIARRQPVRS